MRGSLAGIALAGGVVGIAALLLAGCGTDGPFAERDLFAPVDARVGHGDPRIAGAPEGVARRLQREESVGSRGEFFEGLTIRLGERQFVETPTPPERLRAELGPPPVEVEERPVVVDGTVVEVRTRYHFTDVYGREATAEITRYRDARQAWTDWHVLYPHDHLLARPTPPPSPVPEEEGENRDDREGGR